MPRCVLPRPLLAWELCAGPCRVRSLLVNFTLCPGTGGCPNPALLRSPGQLALARLQVLFWVLRGWGSPTPGAAGCSRQKGYVRSALHPVRPPDRESVPERTKAL